MPGFVLHVGASVLCTHGAPAQPTAFSARVRVSGQAITTMAAPYLVNGCPFNISGVPSPCVTANWIVAATRVTSDGQPVLLVDSQAICAPNGTPLVILATQTRVTAI
jgi:hypothetical protein